MLRLMPVVNFFKKRILRLGQTVLRQGDLMTEFGVIAKGRCKVVNIAIRNRTKEQSHKVKGLKGRLPNMYFGKKEFSIYQSIFNSF